MGRDTEVIIKITLKSSWVISLVARFTQRKKRSVETYLSSFNQKTKLRQSQTNRFLSFCLTDVNKSWYTYEVSFYEIIRFFMSVNFGRFRFHIPWSTFPPSSGFNNSPKYKIWGGHLTAHYSECFFFFHTDSTSDEAEILYEYD